MTTTAQDREHEYRYRPPSRYRAAISAVVLVAALVVLAFGVQAWQRWTQRAPYGAEAVHARVSMRLVPEDQVQSALDALTRRPGSMNAVHGSGPLLIGQVVYDVPDEARESDVLTLFVLDAHDGRPITTWGSAGGTETVGIGNGWDYSYYRLGPEVPWLAGIPQSPDHSSPGEQAVSWKAPLRGPVTFQALPPADMLDPAALSSYTVGITMQDDDRTLLWSQQLTPPAP